MLASQQIEMKLFPNEVNSNRKNLFLFLFVFVILGWFVAALTNNLFVLVSECFFDWIQLRVDWIQPRGDVTSPSLLQHFVDCCSELEVVSSFQLKMIG